MGSENRALNPYSCCEKSYSTEDQTVASAVQIHVPPNSVKKCFSRLAPNFLASLPGTLSM